MDFGIDSKLYGFLCKVADCMILSVLWLVCALPLVTLGAASSALYYAVFRTVREGEGSAARCFFRGLRGCWKQGTLVTLLICCFAWAAVALGGITGGNASIILAVLTIFFLTWLHYVISYIARFHAPMKKVLANTMVICIANLPTSLSMAALLIATVLLLAWTFPASAMTVLLVPGAYALVSSFLLERVYRKYLPESEEVPEKPNPAPDLSAG